MIQMIRSNSQKKLIAEFGMKRDVMNNIISEILDDPSNLDILNESLLAQQSNLSNILKLDLTHNIQDQDRQKIMNTIRRIDQILDMIEQYSKLKKVEKVTLQDPS